MRWEKVFLAGLKTAKMKIADTLYDLLKDERGIQRGVFACHVSKGWPCMFRDPDEQYDNDGGRPFVKEQTVVSRKLEYLYSMCETYAPLLLVPESYLLRGIARAVKFLIHGCRSQDFSDHSQYLQHIEPIMNTFRVLEESYSVKAGKLKSLKSQ